MGSISPPTPHQNGWPYTFKQYWSHHTFTTGLPDGRLLTNPQLNSVYLNFFILIHALNFTALKCNL